MAGKCSSDMVTACRAIGKVCNPKTGKCKAPAKGKKKGSATGKSKKRARSASPGPSRRSVRPRTDLVEDAILGQVGPATAMSLDSGYSNKLQAGMGTMVAMTKAKLRTQKKWEAKRNAGNLLRRTPAKRAKKFGPAAPTKAQRAWAARYAAGNATLKPYRVRRVGGGKKAAGPKPCPPGTARSSTTGRCKKYARGGGGARNRRINWSANGLPFGPKRRSAKAPTKAQRLQAAAASGRCPTCANPDRPVQDLKTCKCYALGSAAARKQGICPPTRFSQKTGKSYPLVHVVRKGKHLCVKAGTANAKKALGNAGCPPGKVIKQVRKVNPLTGEVYFAKQCVKAQGAEKQCPVGQKLVSVPSSGVTPDGKRWSKNVIKCVSAKTAAAKGYNVLRNGTLPRRARIAKPKGVALSIGA